jgi:hypothetical protein
VERNVGRCVAAGDAMRADGMGVRALAKG